jgi:hypothetical protein
MQIHDAIMEYILTKALELRIDGTRSNEKRAWEEHVHDHF